MPDQALFDYIKQTRAAGFSEDQIRQALREVGWGTADIEEGFMELAAQKPKAKPLKEVGNTELPAGKGILARHGKAITTSLIVLVALPIASLAGFWGYQKFIQSNTKVDISNSSANTIEGKNDRKKDREVDATNRDKKRLADIESLQTALDKYFGEYKFYPKNLNDLVNEKYLGKLLLDPKDGKPYLYTAFGDPALNYSLSFVLETNLGTLLSGLQVVSSENKLAGQIYKAQDGLMKGESARSISAELEITDTSKTPFYSQEEVSFEVAGQGIELTNVMIAIGNLKLADRNQPFRFRFTAPKEPGEYPIEIFAFDRGGKGYYQKTSLVVLAKQ